MSVGLVPSGGSEGEIDSLAVSYLLVVASKPLVFLDLQTYCSSLCLHVMFSLFTWPYYKDTSWI